MAGVRRQSDSASPREEDFLEAVLNSISAKGFATTSDVSKRLGVTPATVSEMALRLRERGYLRHERYKELLLTSQGEKVAKSVIKRHRVISDLVSMIGVDPETAYVDTEGIEHHVHPDTVRRLEKLGAFLKANPRVLRKIQKFIEES